MSSYIQLTRTEPVIVIYELQGSHQAGMLLVGQVDGSITIVNFMT